MEKLAVRERFFARHPVLRFFYVCWESLNFIAAVVSLISLIP